MAEIYPRLIGFLAVIRKSILSLGVLIAIGSLGFYLISPALFALLQAHLDQDLVFFTVAEPFLAHVRLAFSVTLFSLLPVIAAIVWRALAKPFELSGLSQTLFVLFTCLLFYCGSLFCYFITLPYGIEFLLGFQSQELQPIISVGKFVTFVTVFILAFGVIFELPVIMVFTAKTGLVGRLAYEKGRRYAVLVIAIAAALLTPTPDVVNMGLMGGPLYLLYEIGIVVLKVLRI